MSKSFQLNLVIKGVFLAAAIAVFLAVILSILLTFTPLEESTLAYNIVIGVSVLIASFLTTYKAGMKGIYYGLGISIGFMALLLILFTIFSPTSPLLLKVGEKIIISLVAGSLGGILGVVVHG
ncbi:MAG: TIGR04086 family membrane protein [Desulfitobacterium sp.]|nr:TIGR04086 family membrane protein [Desulfitobacterium sp.]